MQTETTSSEFVDWCVFYDDLWADVNELYHYLAQLTYYTFVPNAAEGYNGKPSDFLIRMQKQQIEVNTSEARTARMERSKAAWIGGIMGSFENKDRFQTKGDK